MKKIICSVFFVMVFVSTIVLYLRSDNKGISNKINSVVIDKVAYFEEKSKIKEKVSYSSDSNKRVEIIGDSGVSSVLGNCVWKIKKLSPEKESLIRRQLNIDFGVVEELNINPGFIDKLAVDDVINFPVPNSPLDLDVKITRISIENNIKTIVGSVGQLGLGYGITFSYGGSILVGSIISDRGSWSIDTVSDMTFITNGLKSNGGDSNDAL